MNPTGLRRILLLIFLVSGLACFFLWKGNKPAPQANIDKQEYKVRAYFLTEKDAKNAQMLGQGDGYTGTVTRGPRVIKKFLGYIVTQDLAGSKESDKISYVCEYIESRGFKAKVIEESLREKTVTIQVGDIYPTEEQAQKVAGKVQNNVSVKFTVKRYYKDVPYKSFIVVFSAIPDREKAIALKKKIEETTNDIELVSY